MEAIVTRFVFVASAVLVHIQAIVFVVANAVRVCVRIAITTTNADGVQLGAVAVTVSSRNVGTSALVNLTGSVANAAGVNRTHAIVNVVTNAVRVCVCSTTSAAFAQRVNHVTVAVACAFSDAVTAAHSALVEHVSVAVTSTFSDVCTSAFVNGAWAIANAASVKFTHTFVDVVTDAVRICIGGTVTTTHAQGVFRGVTAALTSAVNVEQAVAFAVETGLRQFARAIVLSSISIVVAS